MNFLLRFAQTLDANELNIPTTGSNDVWLAALNIFYLITGIVAVVVIIIAGFTMVTNGSEPAAVAKARMAILYSVIGLIVIMSAFVITQFVIGRFS